MERDQIFSTLRDAAVEILGVYYGGRDYEPLLLADIE